MQCKNCGSNFNTTRILTVCPVCGAQLKPETDFDDIVQVLKYIINTYGADTYRNAQLLLSYISDLAPALSDERGLLKMCAELDIFAKLLGAANSSAGEKELLCLRCSGLLQDKKYMRKEMADKAVMWIAASLDWDVNSFAAFMSEEKAQPTPQPVPQKQMPQPTPTQTPQPAPTQTSQPTHQPHNLSAESKANNGGTSASPGGSSQTASAATPGGSSQTANAAKKKKPIAVIIPVICICIAFIIVLTTVIIPKQKEPVLLEDANVGDIVLFGSYEQDNDTSNDTEDIEWLVLAKEDSKVLVISKYALDCQPYNTTYPDVTWETCRLRTWLNGTFLNNAFSAEEQAQIQKTTVSADKNPGYDTNPGSDTTDKVFLLSIPEAEKYFSTDKSRKCEATAYAEAQGALTNSDGLCLWWLRSPGDRQGYAALVDYVGSVNYYGRGVSSADFAVRPALWINL